jgi:hypothetical protein
VIVTGALKQDSDLPDLISDQATLLGLEGCKAVVRFFIVTDPRAYKRAHNIARENAEKLQYVIALSIGQQPSSLINTVERLRSTDTRVLPAKPHASTVGVSHPAASPLYTSLHLSTTAQSLRGRQVATTCMYMYGCALLSGRQLIVTDDAGYLISSTPELIVSADRSLTSKGKNHNVQHKVIIVD